MPRTQAPQEAMHESRLLHSNVGTQSTEHAESSLDDASLSIETERRYLQYSSALVRLLRASLSFRRVAFSIVAGRHGGCLSLAVTCESTCAKRKAEPSGFVYRVQRLMCTLQYGTQSAFSVNRVWLRLRVSERHALGLCCDARMVEVELECR